MYYLQSRYYNPELGRFISADDFSYINASSNFSLNAYVYCYNCPVAFEDSEGTTPELSIDLNDILLFVKSTSEKIKNGLASEYDKLDKLFTNWSNALKTRYNEFVDKLEYALNYPDAVINDMLSKVFNRDVSIRFRLVELLRSQINFQFDLSWMKADVDDENTKSVRLKSSSAEKDEHNSIISAIFQGLFGGVILNAIKDFFDTVNIDLEDIMNKSIKGGWFDTFKELMYTMISIFSAGCSVIKDYFQIANIAEEGYNSIFDWLIKKNEKAGDFEEASKGSSFLSVVSLISALISFTESIDNSGNGALSKNADITLSYIKLVFNIATVFTNINPFLSVALSIIGDAVPRIIAMRLEGIVIC